MTHICVGTLTIIDSDNGLSPGRRQAIIWTNAGILLIGPLGTNFNEILIGIQTFSFKKMQLKMSSAKWRPFCLGLNVLNLRHQYSNSTRVTSRLLWYINLFHMIHKFDPTLCIYVFSVWLYLYFNKDIISWNQGQDPNINTDLSFLHWLLHNH